MSIEDSKKAQAHKVYWASRRGMLELDLVLMPFAQNIFPTLEQSDQEAYIRLLEEQDQDLFAWFLRRQAPENPDIKRTVELVLGHTGSQGA